MKKVLYTIVLFFIAEMSFCQTFKPWNFIPYKAPVQEDERKSIYGDVNNQLNFYVENKDGQLVVSLMSRQDSIALDLPNGKLLGCNGGEWGSALFFLSHEKGQLPILIENVNVKAFLYFQNSYYCLTGAGPWGVAIDTEKKRHFSESAGKLYRINIHDDIITTALKSSGYSLDYPFFNEYKVAKDTNIIKILDLKDNPMAFTLNKDSILIATFQRFLIVHNLKVTKIIDFAFWDSFYPNSVAFIDNKHVYIGLRGGYARLNLITKALTFYRYNPMLNKTGPYIKR